MKNLLRVIVLVGTVFLGSCSSNDDSSSSGVSDTTLSGTVFGESFTAEGGKIFSETEELISIFITNIEADCESDIFDYDTYISTTVAFEEGSTDQANVVFWKDGETPLNILQSTVIIDEITDTTITVRIKAESSTAEQNIEGKFTVDYCN